MGKAIIIVEICGVNKWILYAILVLPIAKLWEQMRQWTVYERILGVYVHCAFSIAYYSDSLIFKKMVVCIGSSINEDAPHFCHAPTKIFRDKKRR